MEPYQEAKLKEAAQQAMWQSQDQSGQIGASLKAARQSLRERIDSRIYRAQKESSQLERLSELKYLLDKNPDVARILDLIDDDLLRS